jgi:MoxR-like ATPase
MFKDVKQVTDNLSQQQYIATDEIATVMFLADKLGKPLLAEGPAGVGKTELAKAWSSATGRPLIRLQCYEGLDESKAL